MNEALYFNPLTPFSSTRSFDYCNSVTAINTTPADSEVKKSRLTLICNSFQFTVVKCFCSSF